MTELSITKRPIVLSTGAGPAASASAGVAIAKAAEAAASAAAASAAVASLAVWPRKIASYVAATGDRLLADTSGGTFTVTLPASPATGAIVQIADAWDFGLVNLTVARNGQTIEGSAEDLTLNDPQRLHTLIFTGSTWVLR